MIELGSFCSRLFESYFIQLVIKYFFFFVSCYAIFLPHLKVNVACFAISNFKKIQVSHYFIIFLSFERFSTDVYVQTFKLDFAKLAKNHITFNTAEIVLNAYCVSIIFKQSRAKRVSIMKVIHFSKFSTNNLQFIVQVSVSKNVCNFLTLGTQYKNNVRKTVNKNEAICSARQRKLK